MHKEKIVEVEKEVVKEVPRAGLGFRVQHLKSKHSLVKERYPTTVIYPPAHWVPHH